LPKADGLLSEPKEHESEYEDMSNKNLIATKLGAGFILFSRAGSLVLSNEKNKPAPSFGSFKHFLDFFLQIGFMDLIALVISAPE